MSKFTKMAKKATSIFVSLTTTLWLAGVGTLVPIAAQAQTVGELQAQISALLAQITGLQTQLANLGGGSTPSGLVNCNFTRDLSMGVARGEDVKCLQQYLNTLKLDVASSGPGSAGSETTYFGPLTRAAVAKWQTSNGVNPPAGYFGPISRAKYNQLLASAPPVVPPVVVPPSTTPPPSATKGTGLTVGSATQPAATLAVQGAIHIPFTAFTLTASADGDVMVDSITVERGSLANDAAFSGIVVLDSDMSPITQIAKALNSNHQVVLTDDFIVPAGQTKTYYLAGNTASSLASYAGQVATLKLIAVNATGATVTGTLPVEGAGHTLNSSLSIGTATLAKGTLDPNSSVTKEVGTKAYVFSAVKATAGSAEDMYIKSIRWNQSGSASKTDLENVKVTVGDTDYTTTVSSDGKYYKATFGTGVLVKKGESKEISVKADVMNGSARTIDFDLYRYDDLVMEGATFKYKVEPTTSETVGSSTDDSKFYTTNPRYDASQVTIGAGTLRVEKSNAVEAGNLANGDDTAELGAFLFDVAGEPVSFTSWVLTVTSTNSDSGSEDMRITNLAVYDANGSAVAGPLDLARGVTTLTFTDTVTVPVGKNIFKVRGNLNNNWEANDTIIIGGNPSTAITSVKGDLTGNTITPTPNATVNANTRTIKSGAVTVSVDGSLSSQTYVQGANGVELGRYIIDASASGEDVKVTVVKVRAEMTAADLDNFQNLQLFNGTTPLTTGSNVNNPSGNTDNTSATLTFNLDSPGLIIPKGTTKIVSLKGNLTSSHTSGDAAKFSFVGLTNGDWGVAGVSTGADITETFSSSTAAKFTIQAQGGYTVAAAPSVPAEKWYAAGATGVTLNVLRFTSTTEEFALTDLRLQIDVTGSSTNKDFKKIYLYDGARLVQSKTPAFTNGVEDFTLPSSGTDTFLIPKDSFRELTIKADLADIGTSLPGTAGQLVGVDWDGATSSKQKALGKASGSSVHSSTASDVTGNGIVYFRSLPTVERLEIPATKLTSGNHVIYKFQVTADPAYDVALRQFTFQVATSGITAFSGTTPANFTLRDVTDGNKRVAAATGTAALFYQDLALYSNGSGTLLFPIVADTTDLAQRWVIIPKGQTHVFELRADVTTDGTGDSISTKLYGSTARPPRVTLTGGSALRMLKLSMLNAADDSTLADGHSLTTSDVDQAATASTTAFLWSDFSSDATTTHGAKTADWMNGFKVPGLLSTGLDPSTLSTSN